MTTATLAAPADAGLRFALGARATSTKRRAGRESAAALKRQPQRGQSMVLGVPQLP